ncbi:MAG: family 43 glycosylhydrolase [Sedimentisphaerales bacterium]|nr:family 43 glycosylhydrolase [Sedimentisphaerales bacterium]
MLLKSVNYKSEKIQFSRYSFILIILYLIGPNRGFAQNPLILDQFTADPTARVFDGRVYVYPSHDILASPGKGRPGWFCMEDYHVFSSENLTDWTDHGVILTQTEVPWLERKTYSMWAPDCVYKDGQYYFYFPTGGRIGAAIADKPYGPFKPEQQPIAGVRGIDPGVLIDKDGSAYLFWGGISVAKLKDNMVELDSQPQRIANLPRPGLIEGPFPFKRNGIYYLTYPHEVNGAERLEYSIASSPTGPYEWKGVIMDQSVSGCWTNHHSIVEFKGQWYLFYHDRDLSPDFDKNRSIRADYLYFNDDGTIQKVIPTLRGVGITNAAGEIQIDRYSAVSPEGVTVAFVDPNQKQKGWKAILTAQNAWIRYNKVDFGREKLKSVSIKTSSSTGGVIDIRIDAVDGPLLAKVNIADNTDWSVVNSNLSENPSGAHDLFVMLKDTKTVEIDWIKFE